MQSIKKLHNKYLKQAIWICGSGLSLKGYPDDFLDNKLSITLHRAYFKFPTANFRYFGERPGWILVKEKCPEIINKVNIFAYPFYNRTKKLSSESIDKAGKKAYYHDLESYPPSGNMGDIYNDRGSNAMIAMVSDALKGKRMVYGGHGTCLHPCMYVAIMMGCNPINIIGCNFENINRVNQFRMTKGLNAIIQGCKDNKIIVNWRKKY